jgi:uncharacterized protein (TIGR03437 family)
MKRVLILALAAVGLAAAQNPALIRTIAGTGTAGYNGDGIPAVQAQLDLGVGFAVGAEVFYDYAHPAVDLQGNIYLPDKNNNVVRRISADGIIRRVAGNRVHSFMGNNVPATEAALDYPTSVAFDGAGNMYLADQHNNRIRKVTPDGIITTFAGSGPAGTLGRFGGNGGPAMQAEMSQPGGLAVGPDGFVYVSDTWNNQIRRISPDGMITAFAGVGGPDAGHGYGGDNGPARQAVLDFPAGLAFDRNGNLFFADQHNNRIRRVAPDGTITTVAGNGARGFGGDGGLATQAQLDYPSDVAVDEAGNIYIADQYNNRVRQVTPDGRINTVAGNGFHGYGGDGGPPLEAALDFPSGVALDRDGNLLILDHHNNRLRQVVFNPPMLSGLPARLDFAATAGGPDPASQVFSMSNGGSGILSFTISTDASWLSVTPASGALSTQPANVTVRARIGGLTPGEYSAVLTIRAAEAVNSPQTVQVTLMLRPAVAPVPVFTSSGVVHAASFAAGPIAPGQIVTIFGTNLGPQTALGAVVDPAAGRLARERGGVSVLFNDFPGALFYVQRDQINVQAPYELAAQTTARVVVRFFQASSIPVSVSVAAAAPGIFAVSQGRGQAALLNQDFTVNSLANPAAVGSVVQIFLTGQGATDPVAVTGQLPSAPFPAPLLPVRVSIGGREARTTFVGLAPGLAGLLQINAVVPEDTVPADNVPLVVTIGEAGSQPGVTLAVRGGS